MRPPNSRLVVLPQAGVCQGSSRGKVGTMATQEQERREDQWRSNYAQLMIQAIQRLNQKGRRSQKPRR